MDQALAIKVAGKLGKERALCVENSRVAVTIIGIMLIYIIIYLQGLLM
jgi:hypothetical protein